MNKINWYKDKICLNVLGKDLTNAKEIYQAADGYVLVGILSKNFPTLESAEIEMKKWADEIDNNISIGLGAGDPAQSYMVAELTKHLKPKHANQVFTGVGLTNYQFGQTDTFINCLVSPSGKVGFVKINTGPLSSKQSDAIVPIETAIAMIKDMGGNSIKFFNMNGLVHIDEYKEISRMCAKYDFALEPTGGIDLNNFKEIISIPISCGVKKIIPHVYSSIIDPVSKKTKIDDIKTLLNIMKEVL